MMIGFPAPLNKNDKIAAVYAYLVVRLEYIQSGWKQGVPKYQFQTR